MYRIVGHYIEGFSFLKADRLKYLVYLFVNLHRFPGEHQRFGVLKSDLFMFAVCSFWKAHVEMAFSLVILTQIHSY